MKSTFIALALCIVSIVSCKSKAAFDYSESIVSIERSLGPAVTEGEKKIVESFQGGQMDTAVAVSQRMVDLIESKVVEIKALKLPAVKEGENFKNATIRHFNLLKDIYAGYGKIAMQPTDEEREAERQKVLLVEEEGKKSLEEMQKAQKKYADANGFKIK